MIAFRVFFLFILHYTRVDMCVCFVKSFDKSNSKMSWNDSSPEDPTKQGFRT